MNDNASNTLKSLFLFRNGENKGFLKLINYHDAFNSVDGDDIRFIAKVFKRRDNENETLKLINELYGLCSNKSDIDADVKSLVDKLYDSIGGGAE